MSSPLTDAQYRRLLEFRTGLRHFLRWSEQRAVEAGITGPQHQLLLAIRGHAGPKPPSVGELAHYLVERQHSVSGLVDRATTAGLVRRVVDADDRRITRVALTPLGRRKLETLASLAVQELRRFGPSLRAVWHGLVND